MLYLIFKYCITAGVIVAVSELAKASDKVGALIVSLPLITILTLIWIHIDGGGVAKEANHAYYTFWYVLPTLPMFLVFPTLLERFGFWIALLLACLMTIAIFFPYTFFLKHFGINLLP
ncbi:MAG: hypothetical protein HHAS10_05110 [Candidatus Altimarinota bacterium]